MPNLVEFKIFCGYLLREKNIWVYEGYYADFKTGIFCVKKEEYSVDKKQIIRYSFIIRGKANVY